jgi:hypothetical protein
LPSEASFYVQKRSCFRQVGVCVLSYSAILLYGLIRADEVPPRVGPKGCLDWVQGSVPCQFEVCILRERRTDDMLLRSLKYSDVIIIGVKFYVFLDNKEIYGP